MTDTAFNYSRHFSQGLATRLLDRLERGALSQSEASESGAQSVELQGWGISISVEGPARLADLNIGTFATCDALHTIDRIRAVSHAYHRASRVGPSRSLEAIADIALHHLHATLESFIEAIDIGTNASVSAPRFARLLALVPTLLVGNDDVATRAIRALQKAGKPLSLASPNTIGWGWFLDPGWESHDAGCGPTSLILDSLVSIESHLRSRRLPGLEELVLLIDSSADYLCSQFEAGYPASVEELVVSMSALRLYGERSLPTSEAIRRRATIVGTKHLVLLEDVFGALVSAAGLSILNLRCPDQVSLSDPARLSRMKDVSHEIFLHGHLLSAFITSTNPTHRGLAASALQRALNTIVVALRDDRPISTHWLCAVINALPVAQDLVLALDQTYREYHRFVTVPENRLSFLIVSDTQFGRDSTVNRRPFGDQDTFREVQPATFRQLTGDAIDSLVSDETKSNRWSGLIHLGDVVCRGDFAHQEEIAVTAMRDAAEVLHVSADHVVISPGNHDLIRSGLVSEIRRIEASSGSAKIDSLQSYRSIIAAFQQFSFQDILPKSGFAAFREMYSRIVEKPISLSHGGVEVVSFLAPRITVHVVSIWPLTRQRISGSGSERKEQYGLDLRAQDDVREFLESADPNDLVLLLTHVPPDHLTSWSPEDSDHHEWFGPPTAGDWPDFLSYVLFQAAEGRNQPVIHMVFSGHMQVDPQLGRGQESWQYTAGAFHLHSGISRGSYAARLSIDEGAMRIDTVSLSKQGGDGSAIQGAQPTIIATDNTKIDSETYDAYVIGTYDAEAQQFVQATNVPGKYVNLERLRNRFSDLVQRRFHDEEIHILDIGAGAGRDSEFFLDAGFRVSAVEGSARLAAELRKRVQDNSGFSVYETNILAPDGLASMLGAQRFHGIWMCATLLHVPTIDNLADSTSNLLVDVDLVKVIAGHICPGGILYLDNKLGAGSHFKEHGNVLRKRWFKYRSSEELLQLTSSVNLMPVDSGWYDGTNGFDAWTWTISEQMQKASQIIDP